MATAESIKFPPGFKKGDKYKNWKRKLSIWQRFTTLEKTMQGSALVMSLDDESQEAVLELDEEVIDCEDGVDAILKVLDGLYLDDKTQTAFEDDTQPPSPMHIPPPPLPPPPPPQPPPSPPSISAPPLSNLSPNVSVPNKLTLQEEMDKVKLKRVARSPDGTPIKVNSESTDSTDNASFMAIALKKRFASMNVDSPETNCSKGDFADDDFECENESFNEDLNDKSHDSAMNDNSDDKYNSAMDATQPPSLMHIPPPPPPTAFDIFSQHLQSTSGCFIILFIVALFTLVRCTLFSMPLAAFNTLMEALLLGLGCYYVQHFCRVYDATVKV